MIAQRAAAVWIGQKAAMGQRPSRAMIDALCDFPEQADEMLYQINASVDELAMYSRFLR